MDPAADTINRYGILKPGGDDLLHPTTPVIDKKGVVHYKRVDEQYTVRPAQGNCWRRSENSDSHEPVRVLAMSRVGGMNVV